MIKKICFLSVLAIAIAVCSAQSNDAEEAALLQKLVQNFTDMTMYIENYLEQMEKVETVIKNYKADNGKLGWTLKGIWHFIGEIKPVLRNLIDKLSGRFNPRVGPMSAQQDWRVPRPDGIFGPMSGGNDWMMPRPDGNPGFPFIKNS